MTSRVALVLAAVMSLPIGAPVVQATPPGGGSLTFTRTGLDQSPHLSPVLRRVPWAVWPKGSSPAWSRNGRRLALGVERKHLPPAIHVFQSRSGTSSILGPPNGFAISEPTWSPDGRRLAVTGSSSFWADPSKRAIYVMRADGTGLRQITNGTGDSAPTWSDRGEIAFQRAGASGDPDDVDVFTVRPDGSEPRRLTFRGGLAPNWSPDGRHIAFSRVVGTAEDIFRMTRDGRNLRRLTRSGLATSPAWSPNARLIAYEDGGAIRVVGARGGGPRTIARPSFEISFGDPAWRPSPRRGAG